jgi:uncharacterized protein YdhG (YjbR/CyaY superfamily)
LQTCQVWVYQEVGFGIMAKKIKNQTEKVDTFMAELDHPFKAEVEAVRAIIKGVHPEIAEEIKWNAPSFSYKDDYLVTFNLWEKKRIHLVFHNPHIASIQSDLLEGDYDHRRMTYLADTADIQAKRAELERVIRELVALQ